MPPLVLFIEDNPGDFDLMVEAFHEIGYEADFERIPDGLLALTRLSGCDPDRLPALILIDLNLPKVDGVQVLAHAKGLPGLAGVPLVVLTSSTSSVDRRRCQSADAFFAKCGLWDDCLELARSLRALARATDIPGTPLTRTPSV